jgi:hypothetical protein
MEEIIPKRNKRMSKKIAGGSNEGSCRGSGLGAALKAAY